MLFEGGSGFIAFAYFGAQHQKALDLRPSLLFEAVGIVIERQVPGFVTTMGVVLDGRVGIMGRGMKLNQKADPLLELLLVRFDLNDIVMAFVSDESESFFWVCIASMLRRDPSRSRASSSSGKAGISLLLSST